jgi:hypothetical protein
MKRLHSQKLHLIPTPMTFDPRCVAFEGRLGADLRTAEYVGRASHSADAACFRSSRAVASSERCMGLRVFYFETRIVSTFKDPESDSQRARGDSATSSGAYRRHAAQDRDAAATTVRDWTRRAERQAMDMEDVVLPSLNGASTGEPVNFDFSLNSRTMQQMRSRLERRRLRRSSERKKFDHQIAVGFLVDEAEQQFPGAKSVINSGRSSGIVEARMSRRAVKQLMQRVLPDMRATGESESSEEEAEEEKSRDAAPAVLHRELGAAVNALAYVGKTGKVISHGREFLQCERYAAGDVVGCGVLLDTNTFFFTLNGALMGMLAARDVHALDDFGEAEASEGGASDEEYWDSGEEDESESVEEGTDVRGRLDMVEDVDIEDVDGRHGEEKVLYPSVSLHGAGECVQAVFEQDAFQFDLPAFEEQVQKERQRALLAEREKRSENGAARDLEQAGRKDETAMEELVRDFFLHYGYEGAYEAFEAATAASKQQRLSLDDTGLESGAATEASAVTLGVSSVQDMEEDGKREEMSVGDALFPPRKQQLRESLRLRHQVREHIRCFRTAQALVVLEQHVPALVQNGAGDRSRRFRRLLAYCRILCVIDVLTHESETKAAACGSCDDRGSGWNPEAAIEFARQVLGASGESASKGKRKRQGGKLEPDDMALVASLCLYDRRERVPASSRARRFLTPEFRESVADRLNRLLLTTQTPGAAAPRVSALEAFVGDLESLQKECVRQGCRAYPASVESTTACQRRGSSRRRRASVASSSSDDSSSSQSQSEQDDRFDDE